MADFEYTGDGGVTLGGEAEVACSFYSYVGEGGISLGGEGDLKVVYKHTGEGGLSFGGDATQKANLSYSAGTGGVKLAGVSSTFLAKKYVGTGGLKLAGAASADPTISYTGDGGLWLGTSPLNPSEFKVAFNVDLESQWKIAAYVDIELDFLWNVGDQPALWYVVEGDGPTLCDDFGCPINSAPRCEMVYIVSNSLARLCTRLKEMRFARRIRRIRVLNTPAGAPLDPDAECNKFEDVTGWETVPQCVEFSLNGEGTEVIYAETFGGEYRILSYVGSGGITLGGTAVYQNHSYVGSGGISLGGSADVVSSSITAGGDGGFALGGTADVACSFFSYVGSGGISLGGSADVVSPRYTYVGSGGFSMGGGGDAPPTARLTYRPIGNGISPPSFAGITLGGSADIPFALYRYIPDGGVGLGGEADVACSFFSYTGSGGISLGGSADVKSSSFSYTGDGGISLGGMYVPNFVGSGGITLGGEADIPFIMGRYTGSGGISLGGAATVEGSSYTYVGSGGITLGGEAEAGSNFYDLTDEWLGVMSLDDIEVQFAAMTQADTLRPATATLTTDCRCPLPNVLYWSTNLGTASVVSEFVARNRLSLPRRNRLVFNRLSQAWQHNIHMEGQGNRGKKERWDILYEWGCIGGFGSLNNATSLWRLGATVVRKALDRSYAETTRVRLEVTSTQICLQPDAFSFSVMVNTLARTFNPLVPYRVDEELLLLSDEIGLFGGRWTIDPELMFAVQATPLGPNPASLDLTDAITPNAV